MKQATESQPPTKRATISDVARLAGVSISTVSRVVNRTAPVADETDQQVRDAIELLNYQPSAAARSLAGFRTNTIGLLLPELAAAFFIPLMRGIERGAYEAGYELLVHSTAGPRQGISSAVNAVGEHNTDGLLVFTDQLGEVEIARMRRNGLPMVMLFQSPPIGLGVPVILFENRTGAREIVEHLIKVHGRRRIAYLAGPAGNEDAALREIGYREALEAHGIPFDPLLVAMSNFNSDMAQSVVSDLILQGVEFDAIFAADDEAAAGAMMALRRAGKRVPEDVSVVGFDDVEFSEYLTPPLTTIRAPIEEAGNCATQMLVKMIRRQHVLPKMMLETKLIRRQSCGCN